MTIQTLRANWKSRRKALGLKQAVFAAECGVSFATYAQIEVGANENPLWATVTKIQDTFARLEAERAARPGTGATGSEYRPVESAPRQFPKKTSTAEGSAGSVHASRAARGRAPKGVLASPPPTGRSKSSSRGRERATQTSTEGEMAAPVCTKPSPIPQRRTSPQPGVAAARSKSVRPARSKRAA